MELHRTCFLAVPSSPEFEELRRQLHDVLASLDLEVLDPAEGAGTSFRRSAEDTIQTADLVIADITSGNPNVMFELGVAAGMRKPLLILVRSDSEVPFDIRSYRMISYESGDDRLGKYILSWVQDALTSPRSLA